MLSESYYVYDRDYVTNKNTTVIPNRKLYTLLISFYHGSPMTQFYSKHPSKLLLVKLLCAGVDGLGLDLDKLTDKHTNEMPSSRL